MTRLRAAADWFFYALYRLDLFTSKEMLEWKALLGVTVLQVIALVSAGIWLEMSLGIAVLGGAGKVTIWFGVLALVLANYWFFMRDGRAKDIVDRCSRREPGERRLRMAVAYAVVFIIFVTMIFTYWQLYNWTAARGGPA